MRVSNRVEVCRLTRISDQGLASRFSNARRTLAWLARLTISLTDPYARHAFGHMYPGVHWSRHLISLPQGDIGWTLRKPVHSTQNKTRSPPSEAPSFRPDFCLRSRLRRNGITQFCDHYRASKQRRKAALSLTLRVGLTRVTAGTGISGCQDAIGWPHDLIRQQSSPT